MTRAENFFGATDTGKMRGNNEDAFIAQPLGNGRVLACAIDGVGGYEGGEVAAEIAKSTIIEQLPSLSPEPVMQMRLALATANERIYQKRLAETNLSSMACVLTLCVADLENNQFIYAHVGDTRLYLLRDNSLVKVTKDHSFVGFLEDNKRLSEAEAMQHPKRNEINKALGFDPNMAKVADYIETGTSPFLPGDLLMLCSDGLTDLVDNRAMTSILTMEGDLESKASRLIAAANEAGGKDNITVVLVHNNKKAAKTRKTKPVIVKKNETLKQSPAEEPQPRVREAAPPPRKKRNLLALILLIICLILGALAYYFWQQSRDYEELLPIQGVKAKTRNAGEQRLVDSLERSAIIFLDSSYGGVVTISDTVSVTKDSLYINGNGTVLRSDSSFHGPLLSASRDCRYILLQNLVFENADIGLLAHSKNLHLRNVTFRNCRVPVQHAFQLPSGVPLTGGLTDSLLFKPDSLFNNRR